MAFLVKFLPFVNYSELINKTIQRFYLVVNTMAKSCKTTVDCTMAKVYVIC